MARRGFALFGAAITCSFMLYCQRRKKGFDFGIQITFEEQASMEDNWFGTSSIKHREG